MRGSSAANQFLKVNESNLMTNRSKVDMAECATTDECDLLYPEEVELIEKIHRAFPTALILFGTLFAFMLPYIC